MENSKLLIVDDDFLEYDIIIPLHRAIEKLAKDNVLWNYEICKQTQAENYLLSGRGYNAILIDNDFGEGAETLARIMHVKIPVAYITAYDLEGLIWQHKNLRNFMAINPKDFEILGITLLRKKGKNIGKNITLESTSDGIFEFLKRAMYL